MTDPAAIAAAARAALDAEARLTPKPGLVDAQTAGAHDDMSLATFLASSAALEPSFEACAAAGRAGGAGTADLVAIGLAGERAMLAATGGVNTHKGALFTLGLCCAALGGGAATVMAVTDEVARLAAPLAAAWRADAAGRPPRSNGERALAELGLGGARGEAAAGLPGVSAVALPAAVAARAAGRTVDEAWLVALVALIARGEDTNLVARGGAFALDAAAHWARALLGRLPELDGAGLRAHLALADRQFTERGWSPGGSADLLAAAMLLDPLPRA